MCSSDCMACGRTGRRTAPKGARLSYGVTADLGLILSDDAIHYREPIADHPIITHGSETEWDRYAVLQGHAFVNHGDDTLIWYSHWDTTGQLSDMEIGLATLRRDGFGDLSPMIAEEAAHCITATQPANAEGWHIKVNAHGLSEKCPLTLEVLDEHAHQIPGLTATITQNGTQTAVRFPRAAKTPKNTRIALKVRFTPGSTARLFALYLE